MSIKEKIFQVVLALVVFNIAFWGIIGIPMLENTSENKTSELIQIDRIDKDGTIWVEIDNNLYYLYISDNGTQEELKWRK
jgi:hypothetical protein